MNCLFSYFSRKIQLHQCKIDQTAHILTFSFLFIELLTKPTTNFSTKPLRSCRGPGRPTSDQIFNSGAKGAAQPFTTGLTLENGGYGHVAGAGRAVIARYIDAVGLGRQSHDIIDIPRIHIVQFFAA